MDRLINDVVGEFGPRRLSPGSIIAGYHDLIEDLKSMTDDIVSEVGLWMQEVSVGREGFDGVIGGVLPNNEFETYSLLHELCQRDFPLFSPSIETTEERPKIDMDIVGNELLRRVVEGGSAYLFQKHHMDYEKVTEALSREQSSFYTGFVHDGRFYDPKTKNELAINDPNRKSGEYITLVVKPVDERGVDRDSYILSRLEGIIGRRDITAEESARGLLTFGSPYLIRYTPNLEKNPNRSAFADVASLYPGEVRVSWENGLSMSGGAGEDAKTQMGIISLLSLRKEFYSSTGALFNRFMERLTDVRERGIQGDINTDGAVEKIGDEFKGYVNALTERFGGMGTKRSAQRFNRIEVRFQKGRGSPERLVEMMQHAADGKRNLIKMHIDKQ